MFAPESLVPESSRDTEVAARFSRCHEESRYHRTADPRVGMKYDRPVTLLRECSVLHLGGRLSSYKLASVGRRRGVHEVGRIQREVVERQTPLTWNGLAANPLSLALHRYCASSHSTKQRLRRMQ